MGAPPAPWRAPEPDGGGVRRLPLGGGGHARDRPGAVRGQLHRRRQDHLGADRQPLSRRRGGQLHPVDHLPARERHQEVRASALARGAHALAQPQSPVSAALAERPQPEGGVDQTMEEGRRPGAVAAGGVDVALAAARVRRLPRVVQDRPEQRLCGPERADHAGDSDRAGAPLCARMEGHPAPPVRCRQRAHRPQRPDRQADGGARSGGRGRARAPAAAGGDRPLVQPAGGRRGVPRVGAARLRGAALPAGGALCAGQRRRVDPRFA